MKKTTTAIIVSIIAIISSVSMASAPPEDQYINCPTAATLEESVDCIYDHTPGSGSEGFVVPTLNQKKAYRDAVTEMMDGSCSSTLPSYLTGIMERRTFVDSENGHSYCLLMEILDANGDNIVDHGWGTFITYSPAVRRINVLVPHIKADLNTHTQGIEVFKDTIARSFFMAGAHRNANSADSLCESGYKVSDVAHNTDNMMFWGTVALNEYYGSSIWYQIQFHGKASTTCSGADVVLADGVVGLPTYKVQSLYNHMTLDHPYWNIELPAPGYTCLQATENVMGRLLNGVSEANVCTTGAITPSGRFVHIEASPAYRDSDDWIPAIMEAWPPGETPIGDGDDEE